MEKGSEGLREALLGRLPQPENIAAYREEVETALAKHKKALSTEKWSGYVLTLCVYVLAMMVMNGWAERHGAEVATFFEVTTCVLFLVLMYMGLVTTMHKYQVDTLKEVKQVQLQLLELQSSIRKDRERES